jgi:hypothetical protein
MLKNLESTIERKQLRIKGGRGDFWQRPRPDQGCSAANDDLYLEAGILIQVLSCFVILSTEGC